MPSMKMRLRGSTVLGLLALLELCRGQTCETVDSQLIHCLDDGVLTIECPDNHWMLIKASTYYISESATCPPSGTDDCVAPGEVDEIHDACHQQRSCDVTIPERTDSVCAGSTDYVWLKYQCEPRNARAADMCNAADPLTGTLVHLDSHPEALFGTYIRELDDCNCGVTIPAGSDVLIRVPHFIKRGSRDSQCDQKLVLWNDEDTFEFCSGNTARNVTCSDHERTFYVKYETASTSVEVIFLLQVYVPYMSEGLSRTCGIHPDDIRRTSNQIISDTSPTVDTAEGGTGTNGIPVPVIIGVVGLSLLVVFIVILIGCFRYRKDREKDVPSDTPDQPSNYHFITEVYIEGAQKSKLVVDKKNGLMRM